jgi:acyl-CoA thioesterase I
MKSLKSRLASPVNQVAHAIFLATALSILSPAVQADPSAGDAAKQGGKSGLTLVAFGDSLTAGYMLKPNESFPAQLQMALEAKGRKVQVINGGVSGDTSAGGLDRLAWTLQPGADAVILELGANDALRGLDPAISRANLDKMLTTLSASKIPVLVAGMKAPGNWGADYAKSFDAIYPELAAKHGATLYPFFLDGVALNPALVLSDGLHPSAKGVAEIVKRILPDVEALLTRAETANAATKN